MKCEVMGIVNVTPDSFSDPGKYFTREEALRRALNLLGEGADIIDIGGESTRPGSTRIGWQEEWSRIGGVLPEIAAAAGNVRVSVDTYHPETAERAVAAGAGIINCVYDSSVPAMLSIAERFAHVELVVPFRPGDRPEDKWGIDRGRFDRLLPRLYLDPMIGFNTGREEDLELLRAVSLLSSVGRVLVGASRKRIVKKLTGEKRTGKNLGGNLAVVAWSALNGASAVRVHDVAESVQLLKVVSALADKPQRAV